MPRRGYKQTEEHKAKVRAAVRASGKKSGYPAGVPHTDAARQSISDGLRAHHASKPRVVYSKPCEYCDQEFECRSQRDLDARRFCSKSCGVRQAAKSKSENPLKFCPECTTMLPRDQFGSNKSRVDGLWPYCNVCQRFRTIQRKYGITKAEYEALSSEDGGCAICEKTFSKLSVDHDHTSGAVRGLLCPNCNSGLGFFGDDPKRMRAAAAYIEKHLSR